MILNLTYLDDGRSLVLNWNQVWQKPDSCIVNLKQLLFNLGKWNFVFQFWFVVATVWEMDSYITVEDILTSSTGILSDTKVYPYPTLNKDGTIKALHQTKQARRQLKKIFYHSINFCKSLGGKCGNVRSFIIKQSKNAKAS